MVPVHLLCPVAVVASVHTAGLQGADHTDADNNLAVINSLDGYGNQPEDVGQVKSAECK